MGKVYPKELRNKAVQLYRLDPDATYTQTGRDLGVSAEVVMALVAAHPRCKRVTGVGA